jgi:hypothetical protein
MALRHAAALVLCAAFVQFAAEPAQAQNAPITNAPITNPPNIITPPAALPDLVIIMAAVSVKCVDGVKVYVTITATMQNKGKTGSADFSKHPTQMAFAVKWWPVPGNVMSLEPGSEPVNASASVSKPLKPGEATTVTMQILGIPEFKPSINPKQYGFEVIADPSKGVAESDERNNSRLAYAMDPCPK